MNLKKIELIAVLVTTVLAGTALAGNSLQPAGGIRAARTVADGPLPRVFCYANDIVFGSGIPGVSVSITFTCDFDANGNLAPLTFFHTLVNDNTGEVRYLNSTNGLLDPGVITDYFGYSEDFPLVPVPSQDGEEIIGGSGPISAIAASDLDTGNYTLTMDLREPSGRRSITSAAFKFVIVETLERLTGNIEDDTTLFSNTAYLIDDVTIIVQNGATLTIEPGTYILGQGQLSALVVNTDGRIEAVGTAARPIVMTSAQLVGTRARSQWGGLVLVGDAPVNITGGQGVVEGLAGNIPYGGNNPDHDAGSLVYVRVEFAGIEFSPDNELNGIAFHGVGSGTTVSHVQVHYNKDDGVEFFGGTVDAKYVVLTGIGDDSLDWTEGWVGRAQFVVAQQVGDDADQGFECDNSGENNTLTPFSNPSIFNVTLIGAPDERDGGESDIGVLLREGTQAQLANFIVTGFKDEGFILDSQQSVEHAQGGDLTFVNSIFWNNNASNESDDQFGLGPFEGETAPDFDVAGFMLADETRNSVVNPRLRDPFYTKAPDFRPALNSPARSLNYVKRPPDDGFYTTDVNYIGGVDPLNDWTKGWTYFGPF